MDGQKLTRNQSSSLLRSSPSVRSSIHSMASVNEECLIKTQEAELEEEKIRDEKRKPKPKPKPHRSGSISNTKRRSGPNRFGFFKFCFFTVFCLSFLYYLRREEMPTSENLLLALIFIGIALYVGSRNKCLINRNLSLIKQLCVDSKNRLCFFTSRTKSKPVQWYIGDSNPETVAETWEGKKIIREGVEFYSNGDFYEGEFHKGKCNGSGVYNFFVNGRYEGDWVDGRYDGYGIESWAKGSKYRGQYRQGIRHGYGVYRFYTGDSYAGEWCNGQSHGVGVQSCSDGSCYVGEFKYGAKHGLGVYNFRNGDRYAGEYFGDRIHGFGVYHFVNGHCYEGSWHEGRKQGYGVYTFRNGVARCGEWDGGTLKNPLPPLTETVIRAVQAARKAADNAMRFRRVDELVNKAVQAANRAAVAARVAAVKAVQNQKDGRFCNADV